MNEKKVIGLNCPICETRLRIAEDIPRLACLRCGTELLLKIEGDFAQLVPSAASTAEMSQTEQQLVEVNTALKSADDSFGIGCGVATMGISLVGCLLLSVSAALQLSILFWLTIIAGLGILGFVLFIFLAASNRKTAPLIKQRDELQSQIQEEYNEVAPTQDDEQEERYSDPLPAHQEVQSQFPEVYTDAVPTKVELQAQFPQEPLAVQEEIKPLRNDQAAGS